MARLKQIPLAGIWPVCVYHLLSWNICHNMTMFWFYDLQTIDWKEYTKEMAYLSPDGWEAEWGFEAYLK